MLQMAVCWDKFYFAKVGMMWNRHLTTPWPDVDCRRWDHEVNLCARYLGI